MGLLDPLFDNLNVPRGSGINAEAKLTTSITKFTSEHMSSVTTQSKISRSLNNFKQEIYQFSETGIS